MKKLNYVAKIIIAIGILSLFRRDGSFYGFGGYVDNTGDIIMISMLICSVGVGMILFSKRKSNTNQKKS
ncbi:MAG: hypothetical protein K0R51_1121 [Cytophagaceae bacterium]|jgi:hypothetical protein|nr:hypothetical protein [Cytophagaceae bacterium]